MSFKLLTETPARNEEFEYIVEEKNTKEAQEALHSRGESLSYTYKSIDFTKKRRKIDRRYSN